jgi:hypothetical protein
LEVTFIEERIGILLFSQQWLSEGGRGDFGNRGGQDKKAKGERAEPLEIATVS